MKGLQKINKRVLFIGYGIHPERNESVSKRTNSLVKVLNANKTFTSYYNFETKISFLHHFLNRREVLGDIERKIVKDKITHVHDTFVLPFSSILFVLPLIKLHPEVVFIKEIQNSYGHSKYFHIETLIRFLFSRKSQFEKIIKSFHVSFARNKYLANKFGVDLVPATVNVGVMPERSPVKGKSLNLCYLGHALKKKGLDVLVEVVRNFPLEYVREVKFKFAFSDKGNKKDYIQKLNVASNISGVTCSFYGNVDMAKYLGSNDLVLIPHLDEYSGAATPNTIFESMAVGCVVATTKTNSVIEVIKDRKNGLLFERATKENILKVVLWAIENKDSLKTISVNARRMVSSNYNEKGLMTKINYIYL